MSDKKTLGATADGTRRITPHFPEIRILHSLDPGTAADGGHGHRPGHRHSPAPIGDLAVVPGVHRLHRIHHPGQRAVDRRPDF